MITESATMTSDEWGTFVCGLDRHVVGGRPNHAEVIALTFGRGRIVLTDGVSVFDGWWYDTPEAAVAALEAWARNHYGGEPEGWMRHPYSGRRRPDGDPAQEYVRR
jgi:hypothetical protein